MPLENPSSLRQQKASAKPPEQPEELQPPSNIQETPTETSEPPPTEVVTQHTGHQEVTVSPTVQNQAQHPTLPNITIKPLNLELTLSSQPTTETGPFPTQVEASSQLPKPPEKAEPSSVQQEFPVSFQRLLRGQNLIQPSRRHQLSVLHAPRW